MKRNILIIMLLSLLLVACNKETKVNNIKDKFYESDNKIQEENLIDIEDLIKIFQEKDINLEIEREESSKGRVYSYADKDIYIQVSSHYTKDNKEKVNSLKIQLQDGDEKDLKNLPVEDFLPGEAISWFENQIKQSKLDYEEEGYSNFTREKQIGHIYTEYIVNGYKDEYLNQDFEILWSMAGNVGDNLQSLAIDMEKEGFFTMNYIEGYKGDSLLLENTSKELSYKIMYEPESPANPYSIKIGASVKAPGENILGKLEGIEIIRKLMDIDSKEFENIDENLTKHINEINKNKNPLNEMFLLEESLNDLKYEIGIIKGYPEEEAYNYSLYIESI